jgi:LytS/YehU family sensor histidine kinase
MSPFNTLVTLLLLCLALIAYLFFRYQKSAGATWQKQQEKITLLRMQTIRNRLSPHFLFNLLSGISAEADNQELVREKIQTVMMLLRRSVENIEQTGIPLSEELEVVGGYIGLQKWRIPGKFDPIYEISEGCDLNQPVPAMILQIPVENAIRHGLMPLTGEKILRIKVENYDKGLLLTVEDNGIGFSESANRTAGTGTGLKILYQTINLLNSANPEKIEFTISSSNHDKIPAAGTSVKIKLPKNYFF